MYPFSECFLITDFINKRLFSIKIYKYNKYLFDKQYYNNKLYCSRETQKLQRSHCNRRCSFARPSHVLPSSRFPCDCADRLIWLALTSSILNDQPVLSRSENSRFVESGLNSFSIWCCARDCATRERLVGGFIVRQPEL